MAISARLNRTLGSTLGEDAAEDMVTWMHGIDEQRSELRELTITVTRLELTVTRLEGRIEVAQHEMLAAIAGMREQLRAELGELRVEIKAVDARLHSKIDAKHADLIKWSFLFWCGAVVVWLLK